MGGTTEGADVLSQWLASRQPVGGSRVAEPAPTEPTQVAEPVTEPVAEPVADVAPAGRHAHPLAPKAPEAPPRPDVEFAPRNGAQHVAGALLVAAAAGTALAGWSAWEQTSTTLAGVAAICGLLTIGLWFLRAASRPPRVRIIGGMLHIDDHGQHHSWDLTAPHLRLQVQGRPGRASWRVVLLRPEQPPYVVDSGVVEPREFMGYLRSYRPEL